MSYKKIMSTLFSNRGGTPQLQPLPGQIANNAGGFYYEIDDYTLLDRFLILGTESGTYYVNPVKLTLQNTLAIQRMLETNGPKVVERIVEISSSGRAPKNDSALFALALAASSKDLGTRKVALAALPKVARTGTHLLHFVDYLSNLRGWGRALRRAVGNWFTQMSVERLSLQAVKYYQRDGWSLRDLLRLSHPICDENEDRRALFNWIVKPKDQEAIQNVHRLRLLEGTYRAKAASSSEEIASIVRKYSLPREALPTAALNSAEVWDALLVDMPMMAMIRNLAKMTQVGLLKPFSSAAEYVSTRLCDREELIRAKINPFHLLLASRIYAQGRGELGSLVWDPIPSIVEALDKAFETAFSLVTPTNKRILIGVDVSGSMQGTACVGSPIINSAEAAAAVSLFLVRTERNALVMAFDTAERNLLITPNQRLDDVIKVTKALCGGGTDLSIPVTYALSNYLEVDAFIILTDNETWAGRTHPSEALKEYRSLINPQAKLVVMATAANGGTICDPDDPLSFGIAGFDASAPQLAMDFIAE